MRRAVPVLVAMGLAVGVLALPVVEVPAAAAPAPVAPETLTLALTGVDSAAARSLVSGPALDEDDGHAHSTPGLRSSVAAERRLAVLTPQTPVSSANVVGISWTGVTEAGTTVQVRVREHGTWSGWRELPITDDRPDPASAEGRAAARTVTAPLGVDNADGVQVRIDTASGRAPRDAQAVVIDSQSSPADAGPAASGALSTAAAAVTRPTIITRAQWGADESRRTAGPGLTDTIKVGFVHHTTGNSTYSREGAYEFMRALFDWYTTPTSQGGPGYSDMAYNFLVDRYGRLFEGRGGGVDKPVIGGHTAGFNLRSFAVAALGDTDRFADASSVTAMLPPIAQLMAWKLGMYGRDPLGTTTLVSNFGGGTSLYEPGEVATVKVISGHGEIGSTDCPGGRLRALLPKLRTMTAALMDGSSPPPPPPPPPAGPSFAQSALSPAAVDYEGEGTTWSSTTNAATAWRLTLQNACASSPLRTWSSTQNTKGAIHVPWDLTLAGAPAPPGIYTLTMAGRTLNGVTVPSQQRVLTIAAVPGSPRPPCAAAQRVLGTDLWSTAVEISRSAAPSSTSVVLAPADTSLRRFVAVAAPLAAKTKAPLLLTAAGGLPPSVVAELKRREPASVSVVGPVRARVIDQLRALGIAVRAFTSTDVRLTAAGVARAMGTVGSRGAVYVSYADTDLVHLGIAAAHAARTARPLLFLAPGGLPTATRSVFVALRLRGGVVVASKAQVPDATVRQVKAVRIVGRDNPAVALTLAGRALPGTRAVLVPFTASSTPDVLAAAGSGLTVLPVVSGGPSSTVASWLLARPTLGTTLTVAPSALVSDAALRALSRRLTAPAAATAPVAAVTPAVTPAAASPTPTPSPTTKPKPPTSFTLRGGGWGHGVGLSQSGAYGMATEGATAPQILSHYYSGTRVMGVKDDVDLRVSVRSRVSGLRFRVVKLTRTAPKLEVALDGKVLVRGLPEDVFDARIKAGVITVTRTTAGVTTTVGTGARLAVRWSGTRTSSTTGKVPGLLQVTSAGSSFTSSAPRYRYGWLDVFRAPGQTGTVEVVNPVRLHDEYLYGLSEVPSSWPSAALQAQVIAARSFAFKKYLVGLRSSCGCHVYTDTRDQNFTGYDKLAEGGGTWGALWKKAVDATAVDATKGRMVVYKGAVITAYYGDSTGGKTQNIEDAWGGTASPWARSVDDHWSAQKFGGSYAAWERTRSQSWVASAFGLGDVVSLVVTKRYASGAAAVVTATSSSGAKKTLSGESLRSQLSLPSTYVRAVATTA